MTGPNSPNSSTKAQPAGMRILDRLRDEGRISAAQYESLYHHARRSGEPVQEAILDGGVMSEQDLLKFIAGIYKTRFVSTERLAKADVDRDMLRLVPRKVAERYATVPVLYDRRTQSLSIVVADLEEDIAKQVQMVTNAREVNAYIARPASIKAAIRKHYAGDTQAFANMGGVGIPLTNEVIERNNDGSAFPGARSVGGGGGADLAMGLDELGGLGGLGAPPPAPKDSARAAAKAERKRSPPIDLGTLEMPTFDAKSEEKPADTTASLIDTVSILVTLLEQGRAELRGHSSMVARICRRAADRLSMSASDADALELAALLHDIGKHATYHLTAFNVSRFDGHRMQAETTWNAPMRLFESARLSPAVVAILGGLHERWDGQGLPKKVAGADIPLGARVLAMVETFADLVQNPKNPYRRTLTRQEAVDVIRQLGGTLFDPSLVDVLRLAGAGEGTVPGAIRHRVLLVDPDSAEATVLEMRFADQNWDVLAVGDRAGAEKALGRERFDLVISEVDLGDADGFSLAPIVKASTKSPNVALVYLTKRADRDSVQKGFAAGASDYLQKPTAPDVVVAKAVQIVESTANQKKKAAGGLSGALRDMGLPEVVQVLGQSRKTGQLRVTSGIVSGEMHFDAGNIVHALFGSQKGDAAFYSMLRLTDGDFAFDPNVKTTERTLAASTESLLLEGMRRIDEGIL